MKILHVVPTYFPAVRYGGPIYSVHGLAAGQAALGHDVCVFTTNVDGPGVSDVPLETPVMRDGVAVTYFPVTSPRRLYRSPAMQRALERQLWDFDIVHLHSVFLWPTLAAARAADRSGVPYVLSPRGMLVGELIRAKSSLLKRTWLNLFERRTIANAAAIHFTADLEAHDFAALGLRARRSFVIPNGVEEPRADDRATPSRDVATVGESAGYALSLGRLNWKKNLASLIAAVSLAPTTRLVIAGPDDEDHSTELRRTIESTGTGAQITLIDRNVGGADKEWLFANCGMFVLPSLNENFGNTVLEAMIRGKPVIVSSGAGVAEIVGEADCGLVVDPTPEALARALSAMASDSDRARELGKKGRIAASARFGWRAIAEEMIEAYRG